ncbi:hypothetical protein PV04_09134 [Phialophora macrospora]|uniref:Transcription factor domain-containing protein n=1 Tax=Phialophora macrospora TaxID=1851006 RepID=A0A0D2CG91_9EURO|nr:hypothetical protein PV04_09134 [Phialophora macrospora]
MLHVIDQHVQLLVGDSTASTGPFSVFRALTAIMVSDTGTHDDNEEIEEATHEQGALHGSRSNRREEERIVISSRKIGINHETEGCRSTSPSAWNAIVLSRPPGRFFHFEHSQDSNPLVRELLSHYLLRIADISQVINHPQNVFRSIYARYAMQVWTQPLFTTEPRATFSSHQAIFCSIISTAAFHLRGFASRKHPNREFYDRVGRVYRLRALQHLQQAITEPSIHAEAYCAMLSAILTLVNLDVMEGSLTGFFAHLHGCHEIRYLWTLRSAQAGSMRPRARQLEICSIFMDTIALTTANHLDIMFGFPAYSTKPILLDTPFTTADIFLEHTYGVTPSVASMVYVTNKIWLYAQSRTNFQDLSPCEVDDSLKSLTEQLDTWSPASESYASVAVDDNSTNSLLRCLSTAFHCAARIYFLSCFRVHPSRHDPSMLAHLSELTLAALEQSYHARPAKSRAGASLSWPAFVAACEAPPTAWQRWTRYWQTLLSNQIGTQQAAWEIVQEVWRRKDKACTQVSKTPTLARLGTTHVIEPSWASVIRDNGIAIIAM